MIPRSQGMASPSTSFKGSISEAGTGSMRSPPLSRSAWTSSSMMPSPVSSRLTLEFETAFSMEAEEPIRFSTTSILPFLSQPSRSCSSSSEFDTQSEADSHGSSFCAFDDSHRITLGSLIGLPMDSFRHFSESFRFRADAGSSHRSSEAGSSPRRPRTCSLLFDLLCCLQRTRANYGHFNVPVARPSLNNSLTSFTITEVSEEEERDSKPSDVGPTVFENSVFVERDTLGSRFYEFNPLYISDAISEADPSEVRDLSLPRDQSRALSTHQDSDNAKTSDSGSNVKDTRSSVQVRSSQNSSTPISRSQPLSPMRTVLTTVCCQLGHFSDVEYSKTGDCSSHRNLRFLKDSNAGRVSSPTNDWCLQFMCNSLQLMRFLINCVGGSAMSQTMCPDPYPMCPQKECGYPISGCRYLGCVNSICRNNHRAQGVELIYRPPSEFEFHEKFDTQEMPWRPSRGVASPIYGYEVPYKPSRHFFAPDFIAQPTLKCNAIPTKEQPWRAQRKTFPGPTGALSGDEAIRHRKYLAPMVVEEKPTKAASARGVYECSTAEKTWKPGHHISGKAGCETTQQDFQPHRRHILKGGSTATIRHPQKAPGVYKRDDGEWLPPFRAPTPEMVAHQAPGCVLWQCPSKKSGKKAAPDCVRRQGEWQPSFRSCDPSLAPTPPNENQRPSSRQGLKHCQPRPDEWCPPWKQQQPQQQQQQFGRHFQPLPQNSNIDECDSLLQRNATINEDANCTHYLDDDKRDGAGLQQEQQVRAQATEEDDENGDEEGGGDGDDNDNDEEFRTSEAANASPTHKAGDEYYAAPCDACDQQQSGGAGKVIGATNSCWSAAEDD